MYLMRLSSCVSCVLFISHLSESYAITYRLNEIPVNDNATTIIFDSIQFSMLIEDIQAQVNTLKALTEVLNSTLRDPVSVNNTQFLKIFAVLTKLMENSKELLDAPAIKSSYRGVNLNEQQFKQLLSVLGKHDLRVNVTADRDFITRLIWGTNATTDHMLHGFFDGLLADLGKLLSDVLVNLVEPIIKTVLSVFVSLIPAIKEFAKLLLGVVKFLFCLFINLLVFVDDYCVLFEYFLLILVVSYYISSYVFIMIFSVLLVFLFGFDRKTPSILRLLVEITLTNSSCTIYE